MTSKSRGKILKVNLFISKYLLFAFPLLILTIVISLISYWGTEILDGAFKSIMWDILGILTIIYFLLLIYFLIALTTSTSFREIVLPKLTRSEEHDEREEYISGRASRATFLFTLSVMILLLFISSLYVKFYKPTKDERQNGVKGNVSIGIGMGLMDDNKVKTPCKKEGKEGYLISLYGLPFTKNALILFLIIIHVGGYHFFTRQRLKE